MVVGPQCWQVRRVVSRFWQVASMFKYRQGRSASGSFASPPRPDSRTARRKHTAFTFSAFYWLGRSSWLSIHLREDADFHFIFPGFSEIFRFMAFE